MWHEMGTRVVYMGCVGGDPKEEDHLKEKGVDEG
jgi:hypothetical protein